MVEKSNPQGATESIWDYPRPPRVEDSEKHIQVVFNGVVIADTRQGVRVLETGHPPVYYFPPEDVLMKALQETDRRTTCEYKGEAHYYSISVGEQKAENAAWCYPDPTPSYQRIKRYLAFYPGQVDACLVDEETAAAEGDDYYGGWITSEITGLDVQKSP